MWSDFRELTLNSGKVKVKSEDRFTVVRGGFDAGASGFVAEVLFHNKNFFNGINKVQNNS